MQSTDVLTNIRHSPRDAYQCQEHHKHVCVILEVREVRLEAGNELAQCRIHVSCTVDNDIGALYAYSEKNCDRSHKNSLLLKDGSDILIQSRCCRVHPR